MVEVVQANFAEILPDILNDIDSAQFVAIDTEFSGLSFSDKDRPSLFDDVDTRYKKLTHSVSNFTVTQIGLAMFRNTDVNKYSVNSYNIYLYPCAFGPVDVRFSIQASSLGFLCKHNFDFNKCIYNGVSFVNNNQEDQLRKYLAKQDHYIEIEDVDRNALQDCCSVVAEWISAAKVGEILNLDQCHLQELTEYVIVTEIRERFPEGWAVCEGGVVSVEKISLEKKAELQKELKEKEDERILRDKIGFTTIFRKLVELKKPIVGHNNFMDLLFMYDKFLEPLPNKLSTFKYNFNKVFPEVYDTKHIVMQLRRIMKYKEEGFFEDTSLSDLYNRLESEKVRFRYLYSPSIVHGDKCKAYAEAHRPHEAGYDAYMVGCIFLRMGHIMSSQGISSSSARPISFRKYWDKMKPYMNKVNLIRAANEYMQLDGRDPLSRRPEWLLVSSRKITYPLTLSNLARLFSAYGSVDIHLRSSRQALVAVTMFRSAKDILRDFKNHNYISVVKYNVWRHSPLVRGALWTGVAVTGCIAAWALAGVKSPKSS